MFEFLVNCLASSLVYKEAFGFVLVLFLTSVFRGFWKKKKNAVSEPSVSAGQVLGLQPRPSHLCNEGAEGSDLQALPALGIMHLFLWPRRRRGEEGNREGRHRAFSGGSGQI